MAISCGAEKAALVSWLGAHIYPNSQAQNVAGKLTPLGGTKTILATVTSGKETSTVVPGLGVVGRLAAVGVDMGSIEVVTGG